jgi:DNA replication and repair protein RecF
VQIRRIEIRAFRNIADQVVEPSTRVNLVIGPNGQGKTNLVEAITFLSWMRSFRTTRSADVVASGEDTAWLKAETTTRTGERSVETSIGTGFRRARIDGYPARAARDSMEVLTVACLSPDDPAVLEAGPDGRRLLIDRFAGIMRPSYGGLFTRYSRLLRERNSLLRSRDGAFDEKMFDACEEALALAGAEVARVRADMVEILAEGLPGTLAQMAGQDLGPRVGMVSRWLPEGISPGNDAAAEGLRTRLRVRRIADQTLGYTTAGPHTDDVEVRLQDLPAKGHASRGQKKVLMLAWKATEALAMLRDRGEPPVLVLDDALADLDADRQSRVVEFLKEYPGQTFVTSAGVDPAVLGRAAVFLAMGGTFTRAED